MPWYIITSRAHSLLQNIVPLNLPTESMKQQQAQTQLEMAILQHRVNIMNQEQSLKLLLLFLNQVYVNQ